MAVLQTSGKCSLENMMCDRLQVEKAFWITDMRATESTRNLRSYVVLVKILQKATFITRDMR